MTRTPKPGDVIEIAKVVQADESPLLGARPGPEVMNLPVTLKRVWLRATVLNFKGDRLSVVYQDGVRETIERDGMSIWRFLEIERTT